MANIHRRSRVLRLDTDEGVVSLREGCNLALVSTSLALRVFSARPEDTLDTLCDPTVKNSKAAARLNSAWRCHFLASPVTTRIPGVSTWANLAQVQQPRVFDKR